MKFLSEREARPIRDFTSRFVDEGGMSDLLLHRIQEDGWSPLLIQEGILIEFYRLALLSEFYRESSSYTLGFVNLKNPSEVNFQLKLNNPIYINNSELAEDIEDFLFEDCKIIASEDFDFFFVNSFMDWAAFFTRDDAKEKMQFHPSWLNNPYQDDPIVADFSGLSSIWRSLFPSSVQR